MVDDARRIRMVSRAMACLHCKTERACDRCRLALGAVMVRAVAPDRWVVIKPPVAKSVN